MVKGSLGPPNLTEISILPRLGFPRIQLVQPVHQRLPVLVPKPLRIQKVLVHFQCVRLPEVIPAKPAEKHLRNTNDTSSADYSRFSAVRTGSRACKQQEWYTSGSTMLKPLMLRAWRRYCRSNPLPSATCRPLTPSVQLQISFVGEMMH